MTSPDATVVDLQASNLESSPSPEPQEEETEETVLLKDAETRTNFAPVPEQPTVAGEMPPTVEEQELETMALKSAEAEIETRTMERQVEPSEEPTVLHSAVSPSDGPEAPETETIAMATEETHAMKPDTQATPSEDETVALLQPDSLVPEHRDEPVTARKVKSVGGSRTLPVTILAVAALVAIAVGVVYWMIGQPEPPPAPFELPVTEPVPVTGTLTVRSNPEGATVLVDGEDRGVTPLELAELELGIYTVRVEKRGFKPQELAAEINEDTNMAALDVALERIAKPPPPAPARAFLDILSMPSDAQVLMDGQVIGKTPLERYPARPGRRTFLIQKEGFEPWETSIELVAGLPGTVRASLEAIEEEPPPPPEKPPEPEVKVGDLVERGPDVIDPVCIECPHPPYPEMARRAKMEGVVEVSFIISETGTVQNIQIEESAGEVFDSAIVEVVKGWRYKPATKQGIPVKVRWVQRFRYKRG
jgi:TonB family protein